MDGCFHVRLVRGVWVIVTVAVPVPEPEWAWLEGFVAERCLSARFVVWVEEKPQQLFVVRF